MRRFTLALFLLTAAMSSHAQPNAGQISPVSLPPESQRAVIGTWSVVDVPVKMNRSIEGVNGKYYMVSRLIDPDGKKVGGTHGFPLQKVDHYTYRVILVPSVLYSIAADGTLTGAQNGESFFVATPTNELWPR